MNNPGHCITPGGELGAIWTFTSRADAAAWREELRRENPDQRVRIVRRTLAVLGSSTPIFCLVIGG